MKKSNLKRVLGLVLIISTLFGWACPVWAELSSPPLVTTPEGGTPPPAHSDPPLVTTTPAEPSAGAEGGAAAAPAADPAAAPATDPAADPAAAPAADPAGGGIGLLAVTAEELEAAKRMEITSTVYPEPLRSGTAATLSFIMTYNNGGSNIVLNPAHLKATITIPKGITVIGGVNAMFHIESTTVVDGTGETVLVLIFDQLPSGGTGGSVNAATITTKSGQLADGSTQNITVKWTYDNELLKDENCVVTNQADAFGWNNLTANALGKDNNADTLTTSGGGVIPTVRLNFTVYNSVHGATVGNVYTKKATVTDIIEVDPRIRMTDQNLADAVWAYDASYNVTGKSYEVVERFDDNTIKKFKVTAIVENAFTDKDMTAFTVFFDIPGLRLNRAKALEGVAANANSVTVTGALKSTNSLVGEFVPAMAVNSTSLNKETNGEKYQELPGYSYMNLKVVYYRSKYEPTNPEEPSNSGFLEKEVKSIIPAGSTTAVTDPTRLGFTWPGDKVTYAISGYGNFLSLTGNLDKYVVTDIFNNEQMYPISLTCGNHFLAGAGGNVRINIYMKVNGSEERVFFRDYPRTGGAIPDLSSLTGNDDSGPIGMSFYGVALDPTKISKIEWDHGSIPYGFIHYLDSPPTVTVITRDMGKPSAPPGKAEPPYEPQAITQNNATVSYEYNGTVYDKDHATAANNNFKVVTDLPYYQQYDLKIKNSKTFTKLRGENPFSANLEAGDLLEFTVTFQNVSGSYAFHPFFDDKYEGLEPYIVDDPAYNLTGPGTNPPATTYESPFVKIVKVIDVSGTNVTAQRNLKVKGVYVGAIPHPGAADGGAYMYAGDPALPANTIRVRLESKNAGFGDLPSGSVPPYYVHMGDTFTVSYVMKVTDPAKVKNEFKSYAYRPNTGGNGGGGDGLLLELTEGSTDGGGLLPNTYKPSLRMEQNVTRPDGTTPPTNYAYPLDKDELLNVEVKLIAGSIQNAPNLNIYGFGGALYEAHNPVLTRQNTSAPVAVKIYKNKDDTNPEVRNVTMRLDPPAAFPDGSGNWKEKYQLMFTDSSGKLAPVALKPGMIIAYSYQLKMSNYLDNSSESLTTNIRDQAFVKEKNDNYQHYYTSSFNGAGYSNPDAYAAGMFTGLDGNPVISMMVSEQYARLHKNTSPVAQMTVARFDHSPMELTNAASTNLYRKREGYYGYLVYLYNSGRADLQVDKIILRIPRNERFKGFMPNSAHSSYMCLNPNDLFNWYDLGNNDEGQQIIAIVPKTGPIILKPGENLAGAGKAYIGVETTTDDATAEKLIKDKGGFAYFYDSGFHAALYSRTPLVQTDFTTSSNRISEVPAAEQEAKWIYSQVTTGGGSQVFMQANYIYPPQYHITYPAAGIYLDPLRKVVVGGSTTYETPTVPFGPSDQMAWRITAFIRPQADYSKELTGAAIVLKLPAGMIFTGVETAGWTGTEYVSDDDGHKYVIVKLKDDKLVAMDVQQFIVNTTLSNRYGDQKMEAYIIGTEYILEVYNSGWIDNSTLIAPDILAKLTSPGPRLVRIDRTVSVSGQFNFTTEKAVTAAMADANYALRQDQNLAYTLTISNNGNTLPYENVTFVDRLPLKDDKHVLDDMPRGTNTKAVLTTAPTVQTAPIGADGRPGAWTEMDASKYTVEYVNVAAGYLFKNADFRLPDTGTPTTPAGWSDTMPIAQATAFRVKLVDSLPPKTAVRVSYVASAKEADMPNKKAVTANSFAAGFDAVVGASTHYLNPEPDPVLVKYEDAKFMAILGTLFTESGTPDGIYNGTDSIFSDFTNGDVKLTLYRATDAAGTGRTQVGTPFTVDKATGTYQFGELYEEGFYTVELTGIPAGYTIYESILPDAQGNKFGEDGKTEPITFNAGETVRRNADILQAVTGSLSITKTLRAPLFGTDNGKVGGKTQKFIFKIEYIPYGETAVAKTFYEVLAGGETKVFGKVPRGTYVVTELDTWAADYFQYSQVKYGTGGNEISRANPDITATCENSRNGKDFMHAIAEAINDFSAATGQ